MAPSSANHFQHPNTEALLHDQAPSETGLAIIGRTDRRFNLLLRDTPLSQPEPGVRRVDHFHHGDSTWSVLEKQTTPAADWLLRLLVGSVAVAGLLGAGPAGWAPLGWLAVSIALPAMAATHGLLHGWLQPLRAWWERLMWRGTVRQLLSRDLREVDANEVRQFVERLPMRWWDDALEEIGRRDGGVFRQVYEPLALKSVQAALQRVAISSRPRSDLPQAVDVDVYADDDSSQLAESTWAWSRLLHAAQYRAAVERAVRDRWRPGARVLDVGAGTGVLFRLLSKPLRRRVVSSDLDPLALEYARLRGRGRRFERGTVSDIVRRRGRFDAMISIELFDAVSADAHTAVLQQMFDGLRPGGHAVILLDQPGFDSGARLLPRLQRIAQEVLQRPLETTNRTLRLVPLTQSEVARVQAAFETADGERKADLAMLLEYHQQAADPNIRAHRHPSLFHPSGLNISALLTARLAVLARAQGWQVVEREVLPLHTPVPYRLPRPVTVAGALTFLTLRKPASPQVVPYRAGPLGRLLPGLLESFRFFSHQFMLFVDALGSILQRFAPLIAGLLLALAVQHLPARQPRPNTPGPNDPGSQGGSGGGRRRTPPPPTRGNGWLPFGWWPGRPRSIAAARGIFLRLMHSREVVSRAVTVTRNEAWRPWWSRAPPREGGV